MKGIRGFFSRSITAKIISGAVALFVGGLLTIALMFSMVRRQSTDAAAINEAGSLRMLVQRIAKIGARVETGAGSEEEMRMTLRIFDGRLRDLIEGNAEKGIDPPPSGVRDQFLRVKAQWGPYRDAALRLIASRPGSPEFQAARQYLNTNDTAIHAAADRAVELYQIESEAKIERMKKWLYALLVLSFFVFGSVFWITRRVLHPIHTLTEAVGRVQDGELEVTVTVDTSDELGQLAWGFNQMIESIRGSHEVLREEKKRAEEMNRLKSAFLANMSHEVRTPLSAIIGFSEVLDDEIQHVVTNCTRERWEDVRHRLEATGEYTDLIRESGRRLVDTLDSVLELSRLEAEAVDLEPVRFDMRQEVRGALDLFRQQAANKEIDVQTRGLDDPIWVVQDVFAVRRVLVNLLSNAVKFTTPGGRVRVCVQEKEALVQVVIKDSGIGIDEDFLPHLFEPFRQESAGLTRSYEGTGLGLTIVRRLTELIGGRIAVASEKGKGTRFTVTLPRCGAHAAQTGANPKALKL